MYYFYIFKQRLTIISFFCIGVVLFYGYHFLRFASYNGLCLEGSTGRIAGNQSANAGALPGKIHSILSIDLLRPLSSVLVFSSNLIIIFSIIGLIILFYYNPSKIFYRKSLRYIIVITTIIIVSSVECLFSCELKINHENIQNIFLDKLDGIQYIDFKKSNSNSIPKAIELRGNVGEPTCRAFVLFLEPRKYRLTKKWIDQKTSLNSENSDLRSIFSIMEDIHDFNYRSNLYINIRSFAENQISENNLHPYSVIGCQEWPHGWIDELP